LKALLAELGVRERTLVQELLRHASVKITPDIYTQAMIPAKRKAHSRVVAMIRPESRANGGFQRERQRNMVHGNLLDNDAKSLT
jgi:hypothetical protein